MSYTPLDSNFVTSTILKEGPVVSICWILLLASKDKFNESEMTPSACAGLLRISDEEAERAFDVLASPDPKSKNQEHGGRRILKQDDGKWLIVSGDKYQERASKAVALARQAKYDNNKRARLAKAETSSYVCEKYGCSRTASAVVGEKRVCSAHAMQEDSSCSQCGEPSTCLDQKRGHLCDVHAAKAIREDADLSDVPF